NGRDLDQFERWYSQAGTPRIAVQTHYDAVQRSYEIRLTQSCPATPGQEHKLPFHIPVAVGLLDSQGRELPLRLDTAPASGQQQGEPSAAGRTLVLELTEATQSFRFTGIDQEPIASLLRNFSAPVHLDYEYSDRELAFLMRHDTDPFNRWEAGQRLAARRLLNLTHAVINAADLAATLPEHDALIDSMRITLADDSLDPAFREQVLMLPSETIIAEQMEAIDPQAIHSARQFMRLQLARALRPELEQVYEANATPGAYSPDAASAGKRGLRNVALSYLAELDDEIAHAMARQQSDDAGNMTERIAALSALVNSNAAVRDAALARFYEDFRDDPLVVDKWFTLQAMARTATLDKIRQLMNHPAFTLKNPNRARSLIFSFCNGNPA
ncbi:MAG: DUF3458 domain-containing protein, partial [Lacisediminimonas sp.]|nr:DUF3458 domain-containing protein [Lacisediminimonas sp.]